MPFQPSMFGGMHTVRHSGGRRRRHTGGTSHVMGMGSQYAGARRRRHTGRRKIPTHMGTRRRHRHGRGLLDILGKVGSFILPTLKDVGKAAGGALIDSVRRQVGIGRRRKRLIAGARRKRRTVGKGMLSKALGMLTGMGRRRKRRVGARRKRHGKGFLTDILSSITGLGRRRKRVGARRHKRHGGFQAWHMLH